MLYIADQRGYWELGIIYILSKIDVNLFSVKLQFSDKLWESMDRTLLKDSGRKQKEMHRDQIIGYIAS